MSIAQWAKSFQRKWLTYAVCDVVCDKTCLQLNKFPFHLTSFTDLGFLRGSVNSYSRRRLRHSPTTPDVVQNGTGKGLAFDAQV